MLFVTAGLLGWAFGTLRGSGAGVAGSTGGHADRGAAGGVAESQHSSWQAVKEVQSTAVMPLAGKELGE
jgi:hypothetical protein